VADTYILEKRKEKKIRQGEPFCFSVVWHPLSEYISRKRAHNVLLTNAEEYNPIHHLLPYHDVLSSRVISLKLKLWREWLTSTGYSQWIIWRQKNKEKEKIQKYDCESQDSASRAGRAVMKKSSLSVIQVFSFMPHTLSSPLVRLIALLNPTKMNDRESMEGRHRMRTLPCILVMSLTLWHAF
jgi:hypothetical protein